MRHQRGRKPTGADGRQLLGLGEAMEDIEAVRMPAILFGVAQAEDAGLGCLAVQLARQLAIGLPLIDMRRDLARDEAADRLRQRLMAVVVKRRARAPAVEIGQIILPFVSLQPKFRARYSFVNSSMLIGRAMAGPPGQRDP